MRAVLFEDVGKLAFGDYPEPKVQDPGDAIIRVTTAAICGSDLHLFHGRVPGMRPGSVMGHEFVGEIVDVGPGVTKFKTGDRVVGSFLVVCGECWFCARGEFNNCDQMWILGYGMFTGDLDGAQAEYVRIPVADWNLHAVDASLSDEQAVFAGDILTTGAYISARAGIKEGDTVAITGAGPVGLFTLMSVFTYEPSAVYMVDMAEDRLKLAESIGATPVDASKVNPVVEIQSRTGDRGADVVIECVGSPPAFTTALNAARAGGTVAVIGVYTEMSYDLPLGEVWRRGLRIEMGGSCNVQGYWGKVLDQVKAGAIDPTVIISHTMPLDDALQGYEMFEKREAMKVILKP
ncbi:MAG TPA: alcohol dehydrogenase catalytic domain-containing protein [Actinomycetota bacterium]|nr:alcohol dehydrogenase catalytic domain-containing protein [Actinomycetota bacterium]